MTPTDRGVRFLQRKEGAALEMPPKTPPTTAPMQKRVKPRA